MNAAKVNPNGGAVALGHPIGATGCILTVKALYELQRTGGRYGLVTMCIGGGQGIAAIIERLVGATRPAGAASGFGPPGRNVKVIAGRGPSLGGQGCRTGRRAIRNARWLRDPSSPRATLPIARQPSRMRA